MENSNEKYLPLGSIVLLKGAKKRLMITGFCVQTPEKPEKMYDYCGCLYPEGIIDTKNTILFDHTSIEKVFSLGYSDEEEKNFKNRLKDELNKADNNG